jgi:hypothetical protein
VDLGDSREMAGPACVAYTIHGLARGIIHEQSTVHISYNVNKYDIHHSAYESNSQACHKLYAYPSYLH